MSTQAPPWPAVAQLIPHRPPMLLVEEIVDRREDELVCRGSLPCSTPFLTLELVAQTAAVMAALEDGEVPGETETATGYLAAIRDARFLVREIPSGRPLLATVRKLRSLPPLRKYSVTVTLEEGSVDLVHATLSTYQEVSAD